MPPSADKVVVSDCWPLIALGRLDLLALLPALGLMVIGTLGVLVLAKRAGRLVAVKLLSSACAPVVSA